MRIALIGLATVITTAAVATTPAELYIGQALLCVEPATGAASELWLGGDGRYQVLIDHGQPQPVGRQWLRYGGWHGAYAISVAPGGVRLCLRPDPDPKARPDPAALFRDALCLALPVHPIGEVFTLDRNGRHYRLILAQRR